MTTFTSPIKLGEKYRDERTTIEGHAVALYFNVHGCVEVALEFVKDGKIEREHLPQQRLMGTEVNTTGPYNYEADVVLGHLYRDVETGLEGHAAVVHFAEHMTTRAELKTVTTNADGTDKLIYYSIDVFLLEDLDAEQPKRSQKTDDKPSPATREAAPRR